MTILHLGNLESINKNRDIKATMIKILARKLTPLLKPGRLETFDVVLFIYTFFYILVLNKM